MHQKQQSEREDEGVKYCGLSMLGITKKMKKCVTRLGLSYSEDKKKERNCDKRINEEPYGNASRKNERMDKSDKDWKRSHDSGLCSEDSYSSPPYHSSSLKSSSTTLIGLICHPKQSMSTTILVGQSGYPNTSDLDSSKSSSHVGSPIPTPAISTITTTITRSNFIPSYSQTRPLKNVQYPQKVKILCPSQNSSSSTTPQWSHLYQSALAQVHLRVPKCDLDTTRLIFSHSSTKLKESLSNLTTSEIANIIFDIREILYANWFNCDHFYSQPVKYLDLILFCIQRFMILVCDEIRDISPQINDFLQLFEDLQLKCQKKNFSHLESHLEETRKLYIDFWCFLISSF